MGFTRLIITFTGEAVVNDTMTISTNTGKSYIASVQKLRGFSNQTSDPIPTGTAGEATAIVYKDALISDNISYGRQLGEGVLFAQSSNVITVTFLNTAITTATFSTTGTVTTTSSVDSNGVAVPYQKINARSPHWYRIQQDASLGTLTSALIKLKIHGGTQNNWLQSDANWDYQLTSLASNSEVIFNISELVKDYIDNNFDGDYQSNTMWVDIQTVSYYDAVSTETEFKSTKAFYGYGYFEEGINPTLNNSYLQSNHRILKLDDAPLIIPVDTSRTQQVTFFNKGEQIHTKSISSSNFNLNQIEYVTNGINGIDSFQQRVLQYNGAIFEHSDCLSEFEGEFELFEVDTVYVDGDDGVSVVTVQNVSECKYQPYKLTFINKFGAYQDLWFFKASSLSMKTSKEDFRRNTMSVNNYSISDHQYKNLFKGGKESLSINSGFYPESYNEVFKQLLLSEDCWIEYKNQTLPINITDSSKKFKTSLMDKLISYELSIDFAYDKINTIN